MRRARKNISAQFITAPIKVYTLPHSSPNSSPPAKASTATGKKNAGSTANSNMYITGARSPYRSKASRTPSADTPEKAAMYNSVSAAQQPGRINAILCFFKKTPIIYSPV